MTNWISITVANLNNAKVSAFVDALRTAALDHAQVERSAEIIQGVVDRIRDEVKGCKNNVLDADETKIPKGLKSIAVRFILWELKNALEMDVTEQEKIDRSDDVNYLKRVANCDVPIAVPDNPQPTPEVQPAATSPSFGNGCRRDFENRRVE